MVGVIRHSYYQASQRRRVSNVSAADMVQTTTAQKYVVAGAAIVEVSPPKLTSVDISAITKMSSMDQRPINSINRNMLVLWRRPLFHLKVIESKMITIPIILKSGTSTEAIKMIRPIPYSFSWKK